mgnify:CR=1 FL=1
MRAPIDFQKSCRRHLKILVSRCIPNFFTRRSNPASDYFNSVIVTNKTLKTFPQIKIQILFEILRLTAGLVNCWDTRKIYISKRVRELSKYVHLDTFRSESFTWTVLNYCKYIKYNSNESVFHLIVIYTVNKVTNIN